MRADASDFLKEPLVQGAMAIREANPAALDVPGTVPSRDHAAPAGLPDGIRVLLICNLFTLPYRVMRCAAATGATVVALGNAGSKGLGYSRHCAAFIRAAHEFDGSFSAAMAEEINRQVEAHDIDIVLPGDAPSSRSLAALREAIKVPCFPGPSLERFDFLNDKWQFTKLCLELGIRCPKTRLFANKAEVLQAIHDGAIPFPAIAKPLSLEGSHGVLKLGPDDAVSQAEKIYYEPVLVQEFIEGEDIGASVYADGGRIVSFIAHRLKRATYSTFHSDEIRQTLEAFMARVETSGVFNFDMRLAPDGRIFYLECNPRFFYKISLSMVAGINFTAFGLDRARQHPEAVPDGVAVRMPKALTATLLTPWRLTSRDFAMLKYFYSDPIPYFREMLKIDWED